MRNRLNTIQHHALQAVEWSGNRADSMGAFCPSCGGYRSAEHKASCAVNRAIIAYNLLASAEKLAERDE